jgi:uncharacterized protein (DUF362 family)
LKSRINRKGAIVENNLDRREFLQRSLMAGAGVLANSMMPGVLHAARNTYLTDITLSAVAGDRVFENTMAAMDALGGMKTFVKKDASVGLLINSVFDRRGTLTNPDIALAVVKMCLEAGAAKVVTIENTPGWYWGRGRQAPKLAQEIKMIGHSPEKRDVSIARGISLKDGSASSALMSCDVFINIPIIKDHRGTRYTGNLKNMMGAFSSSTCRRCHYGEYGIVTQVFQNAYSRMDLLSQSIADLNLVRQPDLCIADVTEILATNGPVGPGKIITPMIVVAGTNAVAVDMYCVKHLGLDPADLLVIQRAQDHTLGPKNLTEVRIISR